MPHREIDGAQFLINEDLLFTALRNLAENAVQHTPSGTIVTWSLRIEGGMAALAVEDDGPGIPPDELGVVRHRFFRGLHRSGIGTGLGLAIADLALRRAGTELRLRNRPGGGLRAEVVLEASRARSSRTASDAANAGPGAPA